MQAGLLTGAFTRERAAALDPAAWRGQAEEFQGVALDQNLALAAALGPIAKRHDTTVSAIAVAWTLAWPAVTGAIVGARRANQVDGWLPAASLELTEHDLDEVSSAIARTGAGSGPTRPAAIAREDA
jgi:aryl-alcohol dehydrogenase-like predicted oxidoreductase